MKLSLLFLIALLSAFATGQSTVLTDSIYSSSLGKHRRFVVYLPQTLISRSELNVLFATDGQILDSTYFKGLDSLIARKKVKPFVLIGAYSDETFLPDRGCEIRNFEYVDGLYGGKDSLNQLFDRHLNFFCFELPDSVNKKLGLDVHHHRAAFFVFSNGADFGLSAAFYHPDFFDDYILCSPMQGSHIVESLGVPAMRFFLSCGKEEPVALENVRKLRSFLNRRKIYAVVSKWRGGHERKHWRNQFLSDIQKVFPAE